LPDALPISGLGLGGARPTADLPTRASGDCTPSETRRASLPWRPGYTRSEGPVARRRGLFVLSGPGDGSLVSLDLLLDDITGSEPFERLLLERARPVLGRAEAGSDVVVASLARALDAPLLAVAPGPPEAEVLARGG